MRPKTRGASDERPRSTVRIFNGIRTSRVRITRAFFHASRGDAARLVPVGIHVSPKFFHEDPLPVQRILNKDLKILGIRVIISRKHRSSRFRIPFRRSIQLKRNEEENGSARQDRYPIIRMRSRRGYTVKRYSFGIAG